MKKILILLIFIFIVLQINSAEFNKAFFESIKGELITQFGYKNSAESFINNFIDSYFKITEVTDNYIVIEAFSKKNNESYAKHYILIDQIRDIKIYTKKP